MGPCGHPTYSLGFPKSCPLIHTTLSPVSLPSSFQQTFRAPPLCLALGLHLFLIAGTMHWTEPIWGSSPLWQKKIKNLRCLLSSACHLALPQSGKALFSPWRSHNEDSPMITVYGRRLENRHGYRPDSASVWGPEGAGGKHGAAAPGAAQPGIIIKKKKKKKMFTSEEKLLLE